MKGAVAIIHRKDGKQERVGILLSETTIEPIGSQVFRKIVEYSGMTVNEGLAELINEAKQDGYVIRYKGGRSEFAVVTLLDKVLV